ncbi:MAG: HD domain-containing protein [candidate division Zixibacteria bacterium]|nr:HD domain-containing protein [candidate division Zixibacteria bacterium]
MVLCEGKVELNTAIGAKVAEAVLKKGKLYEVGGAVRDRLLGIPRTQKDTDYLVTGIPLSELVALLKKFGYVDLVGRFFGVIKFTDKETGVTFDISLPRKEKSTGLGHKDFEVNFDPALPVETDLGRRDFTINAMAFNVDTEKLIDPFGGQADIKSKLVRQVFPQAFEEDPLRMLRAVQFASRFYFEIEPKTWEHLVASVKLIETVSAERIAEELNKLILLSPKPSVGFKQMEKSGLLRILLPELAEGVGVSQPGGYHRWEVFEHTLYVVDAAPPKLNVRWACLLHDVAKPRTKVETGEGATFYGHEKLGSKMTKQILRRLKYSNDFIDQVFLLVDKHMFTTQVTDKGLRRLIRKVGPELVFDLLDLRRADVVGQGMGGKTDDVDELEGRIKAELEKKPPFSVRDLAVTGHDVMEHLKIPAGPAVGRVLNYLLEQVLDDPALNEKSALLKLAKDYYTGLEAE